MPSTPVEKADSPEKLASELWGELHAHLEDRQEREADWAKWLKAYDAQPSTEKKNFPWPGASNLTVGLVPTFVDTLVARIMQSIMQLEPHWVVTPLGRQWTTTGKLWERYIDWARSNVWNQERVIKPAVLEVAKLGTAIIFNGWSRRETRRMLPTGTTVGAPARIGPAPRWIPLDDFVIPRGFNRINDGEDGPRAPWVAFRQWWSRPALQALGASGEFDGIAVARLLDTTPADTDASTPYTPIYSTWQIWFSHDLDGDGFPEEYVMVLGGEDTILRWRPNPYIDGMRPFVAIRLQEVEGQFYGKGIPEMIYQFQEEVSTVHNQRRDNATLANTIAFKARRGIGLSQRRRISPGDILELTDPNDLQEIRMGHNYLQTLGEEQLSISLAERRIGITELSQGLVTSPIGRAAATTIMTQLQEGARRFDLNTSEIRHGITEMGLQITELYQTHGLPDPDSPAAPEVVLSPEEAGELRAFLARPESVRGLIGLRMNVATAAVNREVEKQSSLQLLGQIQQYYSQVFGLIPHLINPQLPPEAKMAIIAMIQGVDKVMKERVFQSFQTYDLETILLGDLMSTLAATPPPAPPPLPGTEEAPPNVGGETPPTTPTSP